MTESPIPIQNIYYLLCYSWKQLDQGQKIKVSASDYRQYADLFGKVLVKGCAYILKRGLEREYINEKNEVCGIKGKLDFNLSLINYSRKTGKLFCEYDELSFDTLQNQIIKATIKKLLRVKEMEKEIHSDLMDIYSKLLRISDVDITISHFKKIKIHRNNLFYSFVLNVARIIHENIVLDEQTGEYEFVDFIRDERKMATIFEHFVRNFYRENLKECEVKPEILTWDVDETDQNSLDYLPLMKTDISITSQTRKIIIDTKYYKECFQQHFDKKTLINTHMYQLIEYLENSDKQSNMISEGMLLYPAVKSFETISFHKLRGHKISVRTINLNQEWRGIEKDLLEFIS